MDYALEGTCDVNGVQCHPAFSFSKTLETYTPEAASSISQVPAGTIRRIAAEYAVAAHIGSTIMVGGHRLPYRPVASVTFRGGEGHGNAFHTAMAVCLLSHIVGAADVPGGTVALPCRSLGHPDTGNLKFGPGTGPDGMLTAPLWVTPHTPWPVHVQRCPRTWDCWNSSRCPADLRSGQ
jgi:anaerobic selenocysteine-containing dehydrogenase